nr:hypothetical protein [Marinicella sp. W31]MDC2876646.1 hypothetical protein [Marinicella sp. W31]
MILAEGEYTAVARNKDNVYEKNFSVTPGRNQLVELLLNQDQAEFASGNVN